MTCVAAKGTFGEGNVVNDVIDFFVLMLPFQQRLIFVF